MVSVFISLITNFSKNYIFFGKSSVKNVYTHTHTHKMFTHFFKTWVVGRLSINF